MNKIKILSPEQAQKISAGEVIERPVNIIKELVENSLDAGATVITISVKNGGKSYIRIVDNGCGMSEEDAVLSFQPHATSKIETIDQLSLIQSYGFRGEALASIAAISSVTLLTKIKDTAPDALGTAVTYAHGSLKQVKAISCLAGTSITIEELFAMIPVRKKFLKADDVEYHALYSLIQAFALSNKLVHFKLIHNEQIVLNLPPSQELNERVRLILPQESAVKTTPLIKSETATQPWCTLSGVIGDPQFWRYNRNYIFLFVNNRWVKNHELSKALLKGYLNVLPEGRFPVAILFLTIAPDYVDINVHPKKEEVRFLKPATIQNIVTQSVTQTLKNNFSSKFGQGIASNETQENKHPVFFETSNNKNLNELAFIQANRKKNLDIFFPIAQTFARPLEEKKEYSQIQNECITEQIHNIDNQESRLPLDTIKHEISINQEQKSNLFNSNEKDNSKISADKKALFQEKIPYKIIGQLWGTYIIIEQGSDCLLIDQHAAHERILYEKMNHRFEKKDGVHLLFPESILVTQEDFSLIEEHDAFLKLQGINCFYAKENLSVLIKTAPPLIQHLSLSQFIQEMIAYIKEHEQLDRDYFKKQLEEFIRAQIACKGAIKAGDRLSLIQMEQLVSDLMTTERRFICVHGRPTIFTLSEAFIARQFQRT